MVDQFIEASRVIAEQLLPIIGVIALIFLSIVLSKLAKLLSAVTDTVKNLKGTIGLVETSMEKAQAPLDTAVKLSHTVDEVHDKSYAAVKQAGSYVSENMGTIKDMISKKVSKSDSNEEFESESNKATQNKEDTPNE